MDTFFYLHHDRMKLLKKFLEEELQMNSALFFEKFSIYEKLLLDWNEKINLISRKSNSIEDHILNSIFVLTKYKLNEDKKILDIGTGGGFPGIPIKILRPELHITLLDSKKKKVSVLNDLSIKLNLKNIITVSGRAEDISKRELYKKSFDVVISKAVSSLDNLFIWGMDFLNESGEMLCIKGGDIKKELESLSNLKYNLETKVINFSFNEQYKIHDKKLVVIKKLS